MYTKFVRLAYNLDYPRGDIIYSKQSACALLLAVYYNTGLYLWRERRENRGKGDTMKHIHLEGVATPHTHILIYQRRRNDFLIGGAQSESTQSSEQLYNNL